MISGVRLLKEQNGQVEGSHPPFGVEVLLRGGNGAAERGGNHYDLQHSAPEATDHEETAKIA